MESNLNLLSYRRAASGDRPDNCYRCGYPLLGIADEQACPECGLLARCSRRTTDELHNTRPRPGSAALRGANLLLLVIVLATVWPFAWGIVLQDLYWTYIGGRLGYMVHTLGYVGAAASADWRGCSRRPRLSAGHQADLRFRRLVRIWAFVPLLTMVLETVRFACVRQIAFVSLSYQYPVAWDVLTYLVAGLATVGIAPLPLLLFMRLRGPAQRRRKAATWPNIA